LHDVRVALKKLRYTAELSAETGHRQWRNEIQTLKATQELLRRLHDLEVLLGWGREAHAVLTPGDLTASHIRSLLFAVEAECRRPRGSLGRADDLHLPAPFLLRKRLVAAIGLEPRNVHTWRHLGPSTLQRNLSLSHDDGGFLPPLGDRNSRNRVRACVVAL
jgi:hypothetical protein